MNIVGGIPNNPHNPLVIQGTLSEKTQSALKFGRQKFWSLRKIWSLFAGRHLWSYCFQRLNPAKKLVGKKCGHLAKIEPWLHPFCTRMGDGGLRWMFNKRSASVPHFSPFLHSNVRRLHECLSKFIFYSNGFSSSRTYVCVLE